VWATGPEVGQTIWTGQSIYAGGAAPENVFTAWNRFQPENPEGSGQDYMYLVNSADQSTTYWGVTTEHAYIGAYICEYGAPNQSSTVQTAGASIELVYSCGLLQNKDDCEAESAFDCTWSVSTTTCVQKSCSRYNSEIACVADATCKWSTESEIGVCTSTSCGALAPSICSTNPTCILGQGGTICRPAFCAERSTAASCNNQDGCLWRNGICGNSSTIDCNGMDVVFVVDATSQMNNSYGRFPQGFFWSFASVARNGLLLQRQGFRHHV